MRTLITEAEGLLGRLRGLLMILIMMLIGRACAADVHFDVLHFKTESLTNATVTGKSKTDIYVSHPGGLLNVKIKDLDAETLFRLGLGPNPDGQLTEKPTAAGVMRVAAKSPTAAIKMLSETEIGGTFKRFQTPALKIPTYLLLGLAVACVLIHLFFSYCVKLIVEKSGGQPDFLVWIPFAQLFPMVQAAGMSAWWVLGFCIPGVNLVAHILWCINVVNVRRRSVWLTLALILPGINLIAFVYLAFSNTISSSEEGGPKKTVVSSGMPQTA